MSFPTLLLGDVQSNDLSRHRDIETGGLTAGNLPRAWYYFSRDGLHTGLPLTAPSLSTQQVHPYTTVRHRTEAGTIRPSPPLDRASPKMHAVHGAIALCLTNVSLVISWVVLVAASGLLHFPYATFGGTPDCRGMEHNYFSFEACTPHTQWFVTRSTPPPR